MTDVIEEDHIGADWNVFHYPEPIKDPNEFLEHDKERFRNHYQNSISYFQNRSVCREQLLEMEV